MMAPRELAARFEAYGEWRQRLALQLDRLRGWLAQQELVNSQIEQKFDQLKERLQHDQLVVAFVAEFSRGKSELINAIFFADFGQRLLPSSAGRTTMCPSELLHDPAYPPSIRLLPIETRLREATVGEFKTYADEWTSFPLDLASAERMAQALARVSETKRVPVDLARRLALHDEADPTAPPPDADGMVSIPVWRHAIINFPHPLLQRGLVVLDTPGLNAIGAEPELTLSLLPNAHAVLFVLAADAGVTKSDLEVWRQHLAGDDPAQAAGRIVVLNKIDGMWDELKSEQAIAAEIERQAQESATMLGVPSDQVYPVSAQKALVAKVNGDDALLAKSGLPMLEEALSGKLVPAKREIVGITILAEVQNATAAVQSTLVGRRNGLAEQLAELTALRGKNEDVIGHVVDRVKEEKDAFERGMQRFGALRNVLTEQSNALYERIGLEALRSNAARTRKEIESSPFTRGVRNAMAEFFKSILADFEQAEAQAGELHALMKGMYAKHATEFGVDAFVPPAFSMLRYQKEIERLQRTYNTHFNTLWNMVSRAKYALMRRFFETIASRARQVYTIANRDLEAWVRAVMAPLEGQVKEHHARLRRRLDSMRRISEAKGELEDRVRELEEAHAAAVLQLGGLRRELAGVQAVVEEPEDLPLAANA